MKKSKTVPQKKEARKPIQPRGIKTREKIIQSGEKLFIQHGFHGIIADDIAKKAGVSVGSFYAYFKDKYDLFLTIIDRHIERATEVVIEWSRNLEKQSDMDEQDFIQKSLEMSIESHKESSLFLKQAMQMALSDENIRKRFSEKTDKPIRRTFEEVLARLNTNLDRNRIRIIAYTLYHASEGVIHDIVFNESDINEKDAIKELARLFIVYIKNIS